MIRRFLNRLFVLITFVLCFALVTPVAYAQEMEPANEINTPEETETDDPSEGSTADKPGEGTTEEKPSEATTETKPEEKKKSADPIMDRKPVISSLNFNGKSVTVSWKKVKGATGYFVFRRTGTGKYKYIGATRTSLKYSDTGMSKKGTKYYYAVKAYKLKKGKKYKSKLSTPRTITTKLKTKYKVVKDKSSVMYGKKLKFYCETNGTRIKNVASFIKINKPIVLYVSKAKQYITAYMKDGDAYIPIKAMICSTALYSGNTPNGTFHTKAKYRWHELMEKVYGQWCTRIVNGVLFHSVFYYQPCDNRSLAVAAYNKLGQPASHGCVRVNCAGAKWIYDHCSIGTTVVIHTKSGYEPLKKPGSVKLAASHTWDPTDPNIKK